MSKIPKQDIYRINKGVRPYAGRSFPGAKEILPNGRTIITLYVDTSIAHKSLSMGGDPREYALNEVTLIEDNKDTRED